jgi:hypothetical protein
MYACIPVHTAIRLYTHIPPAGSESKLKKKTSIRPFWRQKWSEKLNSDGIPCSDRAWDSDWDSGPAGGHTYISYPYTHTYLTHTHIRILPIHTYIHILPIYSHGPQVAPGFQHLRVYMYVCMYVCVWYLWYMCMCICICAHIWKLCVSCLNAEYIHTRIYKQAAYIHT